MNNPIFFDSKNSLSLFGLDKNFEFISKLYSNQNLPRVIMFSGNKGSGKATLINHFLYSIFDIENYDLENLNTSGNSIFLKQFQNNIFSNIIYISGADFKSMKIEDIRNLKKIILQSTISNKDRFIILDDIELFNHNSLNALLKTIEEPSKKNYFFLINNKSKPLLETIKSRALEIKLILSESKRLKIIERLSKGSNTYNNCKKTLLNFPEVQHIIIDQNHFDKLVLNRKTSHYSFAVEIARLIILNY